MSIAEIVEKWKAGAKQVDIAKEFDVSEAYISQVLAPFKIKMVESFDSVPIFHHDTPLYPDIVYIALKHYKRTWFKNKKPEKEGKMLDEWRKMEKILESEFVF